MALKREILAPIIITFLLLIAGLSPFPILVFVVTVLSLLVFAIMGRALPEALLLLAFFPTTIPMPVWIAGESRITFALLFLASATIWLSWRYFWTQQPIERESALLKLSLWALVLFSSASASMGFHLTLETNFYWLKMLGVSLLGLYFGFFLSAPRLRPDFLQVAWSFASAGSVVVVFYVGSVLTGISPDRLAYPFVGSTTALASYFMLAILLLVWKTRNSRFIPTRIVLVSVLTFGILETQSRSVFFALLCLCVGLALRDALLFVRGRRTEFRDVIVGVGAALLASVPWALARGVETQYLPIFARYRGEGGGVSDNVRLDMWADYLMFFVGSPIFGVGFIERSDLGAPHSLPIELLSRLGIVGFLVACSLPATAWLRPNVAVTGWKSRDRFLVNVSVVSVVLIFFLNNWFIFRFPIAWVFLGLFYGWVRNGKSGAKK